MRKIIAAVALTLLGTHGIASAAAYTERDAGSDAQQIWLSGCSDFKNGMNEGDFVKWLRFEDKVKALPQIKRTAIVRLYMDGWDTARVMKGVINCSDLAQGRANDYTSGIDIRQAR
ncbi:hypothetical protein [Pseudomonas chlororaphis]|uniref:hypothetical protein n=1 Tax=Pseudomonas chlororaphis TaxID=587753 RepID=UPI0024081DA0|nr:hypothetical protein [Pseudomonas chlororaphis]